MFMEWALSKRGHRRKSSDSRCGWVDSIGYLYGMGSGNSLGGRVNVGE